MPPSEPDGSWLQAQEFRQRAAPLDDDTARLLPMAQQWLDMAEDLERCGNAPCG